MPAVEWFKSVIKVDADQSTAAPENDPNADCERIGLERTKGALDVANSIAVVGRDEVSRSR